MDDVTPIWKLNPWFVPNGMKSSEADQQCRFLLTLHEVYDISWFKKSYPELIVKLQFLEKLMLPEKFNDCVSRLSYSKVSLLN
jgi:hypothetical protein